MPTATPSARDAALEARVFWWKFRREITAAIVLALLALAGFGVYRFFSTQRASAASALLSGAKTAQDYQEVMARYSNTAAGASAYLLLAEEQRKEKKFAEANATLQTFIARNPDHEFVPTAQMAIAANLESMGKMDEALAVYQQVAAKYPGNFNAPLALMSEVSLLKAKNRTDEARRICEKVMTDYRDSLWISEAARQLRTLPASVPSAPTAGPTVPPLLAAPSPGMSVSIAPKPGGPPNPSAPPSKPRD
jgi:predicted negative regulator of RcsB-dependent stress response